MSSIRGVVERLLVRLSSVGADPSDDEDTRLRKALLVIVAVLILPISFTWGVLYVAMAGAVGYSAFLYFGVSVGVLQLNGSF
jgi:hypothetical protein